VTRQAIGARSSWPSAARGISLFTGVINLFPFLPLDGGHIFWALREAEGQGDPVQRDGARRLRRFALVMVLFVIGLSNDIGRLTGEGLQRALRRR
jgi:regulator of sigma E protease